jgi:hypothetical protein
MYKSSPPQTIPSFVCYADILGYSQLSRDALNAGQGDVFLSKLHTALGNAYSWVREQSNDWDGEKRFEVKIFTDNIVIGYPLLEPDIGFGEYELGNVFRVFSEFQLELITAGFLVRGGIAFGSHYMDDDIVFGDALLDAVAQDKTGGPPRITLAPSATHILQRHLGFYGETGLAPQSNDLLQDFDNAVFVDYLNQAFLGFPEGGIFFDVIKAHQATIVEGLSSFKGVPDIRAKYEWAARYHNYVCLEFMKVNPIPTNPDADPEYASAAADAQKLRKYIINIESFAAAPSKINLTPIRPGQYA